MPFDLGPAPIHDHLASKRHDPNRIPPIQRLTRLSGMPCETRSKAVSLSVPRLQFEAERPARRLQRASNDKTETGNAADDPLAYERLVAARNLKGFGAVATEGAVALGARSVEVTTR
ncbi:hypothetical protein CLBKND_00090 [Methylorubrum aminovorans]